MFKIIFYKKYNNTIKIKNSINNLHIYIDISKQLYSK